MTRFLRLTALQLAICAMVLRALVPAGWMPNLSGEAGGGLFTICSVETGTHKDGSERDGQKQADRHEVCPFAAAPHLAAHAVAAAVAAPSLVATFAEPGAATNVHLIRMDVTAHAPRAPPALATI